PTRATSLPPPPPPPPASPPPCSAPTSRSSPDQASKAAAQYWRMEVRVWSGACWWEGSCQAPRFSEAESADAVQGGLGRALPALKPSWWGPRLVRCPST